MGLITRRDLLKGAAATAACLSLPFESFSRAADGVAGTPVDRYMTCFYQWGHDTLKAFAGPDGLPNGPEYLHIFSASHAGHNAHPDTANAVRELGPSFKYARAIDIWKYKGWQDASDDQLRQWAIEFRKEALPEGGPADYFAFNEMPTGAESNPGLQRRIAKWMRYLYDANDGGPKLPAVFYLVEENLVPESWKGDAIDELWAAIDDTSVIVVGEHYHNKKFLAEHTPEQITDHLFAIAKWLDESGKVPQRNVAQHKFAVLHSTYYGPKQTNWEGLQQDTSTPEDFKAYLAKLIECTRSSPYGKRRISFGPLQAAGLDTKDILTELTPLLHADAVAAKG
ncbi:MAG TPA: twin-arginine translocation signal domain-containing protein [Tepidisphaeraceae bacterium]|jgi:hypothetical protein|nr:twin-arginine translocation signal domain-containing protein [Tepidisphaeraceae bacterium]